jgi:hypothetical protein
MSHAARPSRLATIPFAVSVFLKHGSSDAASTANAPRYPPGRAQQGARGQEAAARIRELRKGVTLGGLNIKAPIYEGHKH